MTLRESFSPGIWAIAKIRFVASLKNRPLSEVLAARAFRNENQNTSHNMKYTILALAAAVIAVGFSSCSSKPAAQQPPVVDMGARSSK